MARFSSLFRLIAHLTDCIYRHKSLWIYLTNVVHQTAVFMLVHDGNHLTPGRLVVSTNNFIEGLTVRKAYEKWVEVAWQGNEEYIAYNTQKGYVNAFKKHIFPYVGDFAIDDLNVKPLNLHLEEMASQGKARKTIVNIKQALAKLLQYCKKIGWIDVNNENHIVIPETQKSKNQNPIKEKKN